MSYARRKAPSASRRVAEAGGGARVAREILKSLDEGWDEDADAAWLMEIERRMADFDAGGTLAKSGASCATASWQASASRRGRSV